GWAAALRTRGRRPGGGGGGGPPPFAGATGVRSPLRVSLRRSTVTDSCSGLTPGSSARITASPFASRKILIGGKTPAAEGPANRSLRGLRSSASSSLWRCSSSFTALLKTDIEVSFSRHWRV